jgi:hypothetical protein
MDDSPRSQAHQHVNLITNRGQTANASRSAHTDTRALPPFRRILG